MTFKKKLVAIVNKKIDPGVAMNAVAHMVLGFGVSHNKETLHLDDYQDKEGNVYPNISQMPFIILKGKSGEIRKALNKAKEECIQLGIFTDTMTGGTYKEQLEKTSQTPEEELTYYGAVFFGDWDKVTEITKKLSLYT